MRTTRKNVARIEREVDEIGQIVENVHKTDRQKTQDDLRFIESCLKKHFAFHALNSNELYVTCAWHRLECEYVARRSSAKCFTARRRHRN
jgi:hypothetical protein